jgi:hypothetical protein
MFHSPSCRFGFVSFLCLEPCICRPFSFSFLEHDSKTGYGAVPFS